MPHKPKFKIKKSKKPVGNISLHFKDLCEAESQSDSENSESPVHDQGKVELDTSLDVNFQLSETAEVDFNSNEMSSTDIATGVQSSFDPLITVSAKNLDIGGSSPENITATISSRNNSYNIAKQVDGSATVSNLFRQDLRKTKDNSPTISSSNLQIVSPVGSNNKIPAMQSVEDHPLAFQSNIEEDSESEDFFESKPEKDHFNIEKNNDTVTKEMISSALFDSKARTQLFSTIKKNIQQYKNSSGRAESENKLNKTTSNPGASGTDVQLTDEGNRIRSVSQSSDIFSQFGLNLESPLMKGIKGKVVEPLQAMKRAWEESPKENALGLPSSSTDPELRKQSFSENYFAAETPPTHRKSLSSNSDEYIFSSKSVADTPRSASIAMSLSSLLAERQQSLIDDDISVGSTDVNDADLKQMSETKKNDAYYEKIVDEKMQDVKIQSQFLNENKNNIVPVFSSSTLYFLYFSCIFVYFYFVLPLPLSIHIAISSFLFGVVCSTIAIYMFTSAKTQPISIKSPYISQPIPHQIPKSVFNPSKPFKGWLNEVDLYDLDTYHVSATQSVFVTLEGKTLRLQTPRRNIPRRAAFGEGNIVVSNVIHQRIFDISQAKVYLVPDGLVKKRVWSKKYPICIEFLPSFENTKLGQKSLSSKEKFKSPKKQNSDDAYDVISDDDLVEKIYLFGRTQRQKEEWFYRFQRAITMSQKKNANKVPEDIYPQENDLQFGVEHSDSKREAKEMKPLDKMSDLSDPLIMYQDYYTSMCRLLPDPAVYTTVKSGSSVQNINKDTVNIDQSRAVHFSNAASQSDGMSDVVMSQPRQVMRTVSQGEPGLEVAWFNVVVGRIMFDFLRLPKWADWLSNKIQKKLEKIRLPYFIDGLKLTELDLGTTVPLVHKISLPRLDSQGIWFDMDVTYNGSVQMTLETKMVLTKLGKKSISMSMNKNKLGNKSAITNSEEEDSAESSDDDESILTSPLPSSLQHLIPSGNENSPPFRAKDKTHNKNTNSPSNSSSPQQEKRWVRIVDSITKSKYFQKATENSYIKKKLEVVSNTPLILMAELQQCQGTLLINIPPPPSDRIWYGFKDHPHMVLKAHPKLGERAVTVTPVTEWIEKKLTQEFNKVLLIPNMDDIPMPVMFNNLPKTPL